MSATGQALPACCSEPVFPHCPAHRDLEICLRHYRNKCQPQDSPPPPPPPRPVCVWASFLRAFLPMESLRFLLCEPVYEREWVPGWMQGSGTITRSSVPKELAQTSLVRCSQNARRALLKAIQLASELGWEPCFLTPPIASGPQRAT